MRRLTGRLQRPLLFPSFPSRALVLFFSVLWCLACGLSAATVPESVRGLPPYDTVARRVPIGSESDESTGDAEAQERSLRRADSGVQRRDTPHPTGVYRVSASATYSPPPLGAIVPRTSPPARAATPLPGDGLPPFSQFSWAADAGALLRVAPAAARREGDEFDADLGDSQEDDELAVASHGSRQSLPPSFPSWPVATTNPVLSPFSRAPPRHEAAEVAPRGSAGDRALRLEESGADDDDGGAGLSATQALGSASLEDEFVVQLDADGQVTCVPRPRQKQGKALASQMFHPLYVFFPDANARRSEKGPSQEEGRTGGVSPSPFVWDLEAMASSSSSSHVSFRHSDERRSFRGEFSVGNEETPEDEPDSKEDVYHFRVRPRDVGYRPVDPLQTLSFGVQAPYEQHAFATSISKTPFASLPLLPRTDGLYRFHPPTPSYYAFSLSAAPAAPLPPREEAPSRLASQGPYAAAALRQSSRLVSAPPSSYAPAPALASPLPWRLQWDSTARREMSATPAAAPQQRMTLEGISEVSDLRRLGEDPSFGEEAYSHQEICGGLFHWRRSPKGAASLSCAWDRYSSTFAKKFADSVPLAFRSQGLTFKAVDAVNRLFSNLRFKHSNKPLERKPRSKAPTPHTADADAQKDEKEAKEGEPPAAEEAAESADKAEGWGHAIEKDSAHVEEAGKGEEESREASEEEEEAEEASRDRGHSRDEENGGNFLRTGAEEAERSASARHSSRSLGDAEEKTRDAAERSLGADLGSAYEGLSSRRRQADGDSIFTSSLWSALGSNDANRKEDLAVQGAKAVLASGPLRLTLGLLRKGHALFSQTRRLLGSPLTSFAWVLIQKLAGELRKQKKEGEGVMNLGRAVNSVLAAEGVKDTEPLESAMYLATGCKAHMHYSELYAEGYDVVPTDPASWPENPFFAWLLKRKAHAEMLLPAAVPAQLTVKITPTMPADVGNRGARLALYEMWHTLWFMIVEVTRSDFLWTWIKRKDVQHVFPGWTITTVGVHRVTERRPVRYANGVWRFRNIDPVTLEVIPRADGVETNPFEVLPPPRQHVDQVNLDDNLATTGGVNQSPWSFIAESLYANIARGGATPETVEDNADPVKPRTFYYGNKALTIYPDQCGEDATFTYAYDAPFSFLMTPADLPERVYTRIADEQEKPQRRGGGDSCRIKADESVYGNLVDAVWAFKPTSMPKMWLINRTVRPMVSEPLLSANPEARVHRGYHLLFTTSYKPRVEQFISQLTASSPPTPSSSFVSPAAAGLHALWLAYRHRSKKHPVTIVFSGHSQGGVAAQMSAFFFAKQMREVIQDGTVRVYVVVFGMPVWCTQAMYDEMRQSGVIIHEIASNIDPVPVLLATTHGLAQDRNIVSFKLEDMYKVSFRDPFPFEGLIWKYPRRKVDRKTHLIRATLRIEPLVDPAVNFGLTHSHFYAAALGLLSQRYKDIGWMSFLGFPLVPPHLQTTPPHVPEGMQGLREGHRLLLDGQGVLRPHDTPFARGLKLLKSLHHKNKARGPTLPRAPWSPRGRR
ncbi:lipase [Besnoitia besnoiti]|uniref:Lipase n=1 Tax=Besnoitia besnoiti TaxID=94643 RepID=A0A2A9MPR7_BESBE|nr:lipase [Besnoitia besnoiti]PFH37842.1 lipase [Besnoitia besnoiti]